MLGQINRGYRAEILVASLKDVLTIGKTITVINDETLVPNSWHAALPGFPGD
ncbi:MAG: hypothetical protein P8L66_08670 [Rhodospirillaceae bacterium]|nr:hypothetical protein [Rhodospirillaceae bacterium]